MSLLSGRYDSAKLAIIAILLFVTSIPQRLSFLYSAISGALPLDVIGYVGSIFWIFGAFGPRLIRPDQAPYLGDYTGVISPGTASAWSMAIAFLIHIALPVFYILFAGPFSVRADWYPMSTNSRVHRAKMRGDLRLESGGPTRIVVPTEVIENLRSYELEFQTTTPLDITIWDEPNDDQNWDRENKLLSSEEIVHTTFTPVFEIEAVDGLGTGGNHHISVSNKGLLRNRKLLHIPIVE